MRVRPIEQWWLLPALLVLGLIGWAAVSLWGAATDGVEWDVIGRIFDIQAGGPAEQAGLQVGDVLISVGDCPRARWDVCGYRIGQPGDVIHVKFWRQGQLCTATVTAELPSVNYRLVLISILLAALVFSLSSLFLLLRRPEAVEIRVFYALCQAVATGLTVGALDSAMVPFGPRWFHILNGMLPPMMIHFHAVFPQRHWLARKQWPLLALYGTGWFLVVLRWLHPALSYPPIATLQTIMHVWMLVGLTGSIALVVTTYVITNSPAARRRIRLLVFGSVLGLVPIALVTAAPTAGFGAEPWMRWPVVIPLMGAMPVAYAVALWRYTLVEFDRALNRGLVYLAVSTILFGMYFAALTFFHTLLPANMVGRAALGAAVALVAAVTFQPLRVRIQGLVDRLFYGGWYDYRGLVEGVGQALARTLDQETLVEVLVRRVPRAMHLPGAALWLEQDGEMALVSTGGRWSGGGTGAPDTPARTAPNRASIQGPVSLGQERALVPLVVEGRGVGMWALAARPTGEWGPEDGYILAALGRQAALAVQNVRLVAALRDQMAEVEEAHRRLLAAREEERAGLARELHDGVIQDLIGLRYRLEAIQEEGGAAGQVGEMLHGRVGELVEELRRICSDLRVLALDQSGLAAALQALAQEVTARGLPVEACLEDVTLPDGIAIGLYRIGQEALSNAWRHAGASRALMTLVREDHEVWLTVADDGRGFDPASAHERDGRFGLRGMAERADALGGSLAIESAPGEGTRVTVRCGVPLFP